MLRKLSHRRDDAAQPGCEAGGCLIQGSFSGLPESYDIDPEKVEIRISDAGFPAPFQEGLEYSAPARGTWNILHTGMMIPESHHIFVCAKGCLRGVVLTAAEMGAMDRYSAIELREENVLTGNIEELMLEGVEDVLVKLPYRPKAILLYISCQHFFLAYDQDYVYDTLRQSIPDIDFIDCYMIPTLRKSGITPDEKMRMQLYEPLQMREKDKKQINIIGSNLRIDDSCELYGFIESAGYRLAQIQDCRTYSEYLDMAKASLNVYTEPAARRAADRLEKRLGQKSMYLPYTFAYDEIDRRYGELAEIMGIPAPDFSAERLEAERALEKTANLLGETPVAVDFTFTFRILSFSRLLLEHGIRVREIYVDQFYPEEKEDFSWIRENHPEILVASCKRPERRVLSRHREENYLAVGQKAAYFTGTEHFVNVAEGGGFMGYGGIVEIAKLMREAYLEKKDCRVLIQKKGYGCLSLI